MTRMSGKNLFLLELLGLVILVNLVMPVPLVTCHLADAGCNTGTSELVFQCHVKVVMTFVSEPTACAILNSQC